MIIPKMPESTDFFVWPRSQEARTLQEKIYRHLTYLLVCGYFRPGETMSLKKLSLALKVSEMPVRNAVNRLIAESALELSESKHIQLPVLSEPEFTELTELRVALETGIVRYSLENITASEIRQLHKINDELLKNIEKNRFQGSIEQNQKFHLTVYAISGKTLTLSMIASLWLRAGPFMHYSLRTSDQITWRATHHLALLEGLSEGDLAKCEKAISNDIMDTYNLIIASGVFDTFLESMEA
jgi:DNA-binding GntR family transcriptional regulator